MRSINEIVFIARRTKSLNDLISLWNEIVINKKKYPLTKIWFAREEISKVALVVKGSDFDKIMFYHFLKQYNK